MLIECSNDVSCSTWYAARQVVIGACNQQNSVAVHPCMTRWSVGTLGLCALGVLLLACTSPGAAGSAGPTSHCGQEPDAELSCGTPQTKQEPGDRDSTVSSGVVAVPGERPAGSWWGIEEWTHRRRLNAVLSGAPNS